MGFNLVLNLKFSAIITQHVAVAKLIKENKMGKRRTELHDIANPSSTISTTGVGATTAGEVKFLKALK